MNRKLARILFGPRTDRSTDALSDALSTDGLMALVNVETVVSRPRASVEADLILRARAMEADAWDAIYTAHYSAIHRYCAYRIHESEAAEDLAAEVFLEAVRGIKRYQFRGTPFRAWLYRIAHNLTVDEQRRRLRESGRNAVIETSAAEGDFAADVAGRWDMQVALSKLTPDQQQVVILRFMEGLSLNEAATVLKRPAGAVKSLQHRAVRRLRTLLQGEVV